LGITDSTAPTTVPAVVATTCVTVSATLEIFSAARRMTVFALRLLGSFFATFFIMLRADFAPRLAIFVTRLPARAAFFVAFFAVFLMAFFAVFLVIFFPDIFFPDVRFALFFAMLGSLLSIGDQLFLLSPADANRRMATNTR
jgi:hypothetical protein